MLVSIRPSTFLDEVHHATPDSSFDETRNFYCTLGDRIDGWDFDRFDRFAPTEPERLGGGVCYRDVGPLGNAVADFFPAKTGVFIRVHK